MLPVVVVELKVTNGVTTTQSTLLVAVPPVIFTVAVVVCVGAAPIEIGNYVWKDLNRNGIQDPIEPPLANITVQLLKNNIVVATAITNKNGNYLFSNAENPLQNEYPAAFIYGLNDLKENGIYKMYYCGYSDEYIE